VSALNELDAALRSGAGKGELVRLLAYLDTYTREHFRREEGYMRQVSCPATGENCRAHAELVAKLEEWNRQIAAAGASTTLVLTVFRETSRWVQAHILKVDCKLRSCRAAA
jgi:hemerythrin-like metal-binding protein